MCKEIIISFVVPVYNQSKLIEIWLEKALHYKGNDVEFIISDDGSEDDLLNTIKKFNDERIRVVTHESRLGQDRNILFGFRECRGKYIWLFRTKDFIIWQKVEYVIDILKKIIA